MTATVIIVAYRTPELDLGWVPDRAAVIVVHNDGSLAPESVDHPAVTHLHPGENLGYGRAVNLALGQVRTERTIVANPDLKLERRHFEALASAPSGVVVTVPLVDLEGEPTPVLVPNYSPVTFLLTTLRAGRLIGRGSPVRAWLLARTRWGRNLERAGNDFDERRLAGAWVGGALFSVDTARLRAVEGFDPDFFLYFEDADLSQRLADRFPELRVRNVSGPPGVHAVGGSSPDRAARRRTRRIQWDSASVFAARQPGWSWLPARALATAGSRLFGASSDGGG
ncbi:MAG: glycosyltransferase family 2 protein [Actinomycetia bacterium]|nr:glycosyltransferase family 2 protein [Actinomycetes bacterium]